jgi:hypothetical protein
LYGLTGDLLVGELVLELISIKVELGNHLIDLLDVRLKPLFGLLDALVPEHCVESLDVLLGDEGVCPQLQVGTAGLAGKHVSLTFHEGVLDSYKELAIGSGLLKNFLR